MDLKKDPRAVLYVRGIALANKNFLIKEADKRKITVAELLNTILTKRRSNGNNRNNSVKSTIKSK